MGFRSTVVTDDWRVAWPEWFKDKYVGSLTFGKDGNGPLAPLFECKSYGAWNELAEDVQRAIDWEDFPSNFVMVFLHECGGVTRCQIERDRIAWSEPTGWRQTDGVEHEYCYGCSDVPSGDAEAR